ncbi:MAG: EAL domain-containing protein [Spirochaetales bacterium]|nr:EAL domain-containing protein [Spirochaetales bacterium]
MDLLFSQLPLVIHAALLVGTLNILFLKDIVPLKSLLLWYGMLATVTALRQIYYLLYKRDAYRHLKQYYLVNFTGMVLSSSVWGSTGFIIFGSEPLNNFLIIITILGIIIAGITSLASDRRMLFSFISIIILPLMLKVFLFNQKEYNLIGVFLLIFFLLMVTVAIRINKLIVSNLSFEESQMKIIEKLTYSEERFRSIFEKAPSGIFYYNQSLIISECNEVFAAILDAPREKFLNLDMNLLHDKRIIPFLEKPFSGGMGTYEGYYNSTISGKGLWISMICSPLFNKEGDIKGAVGIVQNRSEFHKIEEKMTFMAYHDNLTGLPNRLLLKDRLGQAVMQAGRGRYHGALLFLDLDNFKTINDSLGHETGDMLLIETGERIRSLLREEDTVSRIGGDEFVIILNRLRESEGASISAAGLVADKIHQKLTEPFHLDNKSLYTSTSIGIVLFSHKDEDIETLLKNADAAMYEAKKEGRSSTHYFNEEINQSMKKRVALENSLRQAVRNSELAPYFQPIVLIGDRGNRICGAEALIRWFHPSLGNISPAEFIPLAEETGQILDIGEWLIGEVCRIYGEWLKIGSVSLDYVSINLSVLQLQQKDFFKSVLSHLKRNSIPPSAVVLEITENVLVGKFDRVNSNISALRKEGIRFAIDDFGTGYSSLTYLKKLSLDIIKIDRTFIREIHDDREDRSLVQAILNIARDFGFKVIAEGVEEEQQIKIMEEMGCFFIQGYYFSKPLPADGFLRFYNSFRS